MSLRRKLSISLLLILLIVLIHLRDYGKSIKDEVQRNILHPTPLLRHVASTVGLGSSNDDDGMVKKLRGKTILVTGAAGYIGSHMSLLLLENGVDVIGVDNLSRGSQKALDVLLSYPNFSFRNVDLGDVTAVYELFLLLDDDDDDDGGTKKKRKKIDTVIHFAAIAFVQESVDHPDMYHQNITRNTEILVDAMIAANIPKLIYSSTCAVYGSPKTFPITEQTEMHPLSPYGEAKLNAERYIHSKIYTNKSENSTLTAHLLRYFNVVGADHKSRLGENPRPNLAKYGRLWTACIDVIFRRKSCVRMDDDFDTIDGTSIRDYIHVEDLVRAHAAVLSLEKKVEKVEVWNVGTELPTSTLQYVEAAQRVSGVFIPICFTNYSTGHSPSKIYASSDKLRSRTGWEPKYTNVDSILDTAWKYRVKAFEMGYGLDNLLVPTKEQKSLLKEELQSVIEPHKHQHYDVCIVGAGLSAAVLSERHVSTYNHSVLILEKRDHIGGNCYDYIDNETDIRVSKYGIHLFHTNYERVWNYVTKFSRWTPWEHKCIAKVNDLYVPVPVNIDTINMLFNTTITSEVGMKQWLSTVQITPPNGGEATNSEEVALQRVGHKLYDMIFKPYTIKQWNKDPKELGPSVLARIPVRINRDNRYFADPYQAVPTNGYTRIFENMFAISSQITIQLNTDYFDVKSDLQCGHTYFTGPIDAYFASQKLDKLEYRSLEFDRVVYKNTEYYQPRAHVNYPSLQYNYTRAIEYKHVLNQQSPHTVVFFERSSDVGEPYYPVPNQRNQDLYAKYKQMSDEEVNVTFVGRLANYKYFNMDQTVLNALELFDLQQKDGVF